MKIEKVKINWLSVYLIFSSAVILYMTLSNFGVIDLSRETTPLYEMDLVGMPECERDSLSQTVICLKWYIKGIYEFRASDNSHHLSLEELKEFGGDCVDYSSFYLTALKGYGYEAKPVFTVGHVFVVAYTSDEICMVDQTDSHCNKLGG